MAQLSQAISEAKAGNKETAKRLLADIIKAEPQNEMAWLWLSVCVENIEQKKYCLSKALSINPANQNAKKALEQLNPLPQPSLEELSTPSNNLEVPKEISLTSKSDGIKITQPTQQKKIPVQKSRPHQNLPQKAKNKRNAKWIIFSTITIFTIIGIVVTFAILANTFKNKGNPVIPTQAALNPTSDAPIEIISPTPYPSKTPTPTTTPRPTNTPGPTNTPEPTQTPLPTPTPIYGSYDVPLKIGDSFAMEMIPEAYRKPGKSGYEELMFTLLEVKTGDEAKTQAKKTIKWPNYKDPIPGQEYVAVKGHMKLLWLEDNNTVTYINPGWSLTLRYNDQSDDIWAENISDRAGPEGYPPIEGDFWLFFLIKQDTRPRLYFQTELLVSEEHGYRNIGVYFDLFTQP